jgi:subfamily B ATP-binding cassette protein HlyB/CyaB
MLFITHQVPKGLHVDEVVELGAIVRQMGLVEEAQAG